MRSFSQLVFSLILLMGSINANAASEQDYLDFFKKYQALNDAYDPSVAEMYSDDAVMISNSIMPDGTENMIKFKGHSMKSMFKGMMEIAETSGVKSEFDNVAIAVQGNQAKLTAHRYSTFSCHTDKSYYMVIQQQKNGELKIVEEYAEEPFQSKCEKQDDHRLETMLKSAVLLMNKNVPIKVDPQVELTMASSEGNTLFYHYTLTNVPSTGVPGEDLKNHSKPLIIEMVCNNPSVTPLRDMGVVFSFIYYGSDNIEITRLSAQKSDCDSGEK